MPIRPEDFDVDPPRRTGVGKPVPDDRRTFDKQARARQEREISASIGQTDTNSQRRTVVWAIAAVLAVIILFASEKPLVHFVRKVLGKPVPLATHEPTSNIQRLPVEEPAQPAVKPPNPPPGAVSQTSSTPNQKPEEVTNSPPHRIRRPLPGEIAREKNESQVPQQGLERQQSELAQQRKRLAEAQLALENQRRQEAAEAARASEQAKQEELIHQQKLQQLEDSLRAKSKAETPNEERKSAYLGPSHGDLQWEGYIGGDSFIDIANDTPNVGTLSGEFLPGIPVMVTVSPSDAVTISSPPSPSNQWRRIVLHVRAKSPKKLTVKVHWILP